MNHRAATLAKDLRVSMSAFVGCALCAAVSIARESYLMTDVGVFLGYALVFSLLVGVVFGRLRTLLARLRPAIAPIVTLLVGLVAALGWHSLLYVVWGGWTATTGIPLLFCWLGGGLAAGYTALSSNSFFQPGSVLYIAMSVLVLAVAWVQLNSTPPTLTVVLEDSADSVTDIFFHSVIGVVQKRPTEHALRPEITRATVIRAKPTPVIEIQLRSRLPDTAWKAVIARILAYPPVAEVSSSGRTIYKRR